MSPDEADEHTALLDSLENGHKPPTISIQHDNEPSTSQLPQQSTSNLSAHSNYGTSAPPMSRTSSTDSNQSQTHSIHKTSFRHRKTHPKPNSIRSTTNSHTQTNTKKPRGLRSKLLFIAITLLLAICVYASFVDSFLDQVEAGISCGTCIGLLVPLRALAHVGDDAFVDFFVGFCTKLGVSNHNFVIIFFTDRHVHLIDRLKMQMSVQVPLVHKHQS